MVSTVAGMAIWATLLQSWKAPPEIIFNVFDRMSVLAAAQPLKALLSINFTPSARLMEERLVQLEKASLPIVSIPLPKTTVSSAEQLKKSRSLIFLTWLPNVTFLSVSFILKRGESRLPSFPQVVVYVLPIYASSMG